VCCWPAGIPWQSAALKSTAQDDPHFKLFRLVLRPKGGTAAGALRQQQPSEAGPAAGGGAVIGMAGSRALNVPAYDAAWDDLKLDIQVSRPIKLLTDRLCMSRLAGALGRGWL
jgi:hypothetical protein